MPQNLKIQYNDNVLLGSGLSEERSSDEARLLLGAKPYELRRLTVAQAARFCDSGRLDFLLDLPWVGVGVLVSNLQSEEAKAEWSFARIHGARTESEGLDVPRQESGLPSGGRAT